MPTLAEKREDAAERNFLSEILLVACDQSYNTAPPLHLAPFSDSEKNGGADVAPNAMPETWRNLGLDEWIRDRRFDDPKTGFGAVYKKDNADGSLDYIVAMQGTRGPNIPGLEWKSHLRFDKWAVVERRTSATAYLLTLSTSMRFISGQSLGGALAQYALYDYAVALERTTRTIVEA